MTEPPLANRCNAAGHQLLLGLALVVSSAAMLSPTVPMEPPFAHFDKLVHLSTFLVLARLADAGWPQHGFVLGKWLPLLGYGVLIECLQYGIPTRSFDLLDILADASGLLLYGSVRLAWRQRSKPRRIAVEKVQTR